MNKRTVFAVAAILGTGFLIFLSIGDRFPSRSATTVPAPSAQSAEPALPSAGASEHSSLPSVTRDLLKETSFAEGLAHWTSIAQTRTARGVSCPSDFILELPYEIETMSNDRWTVFTCSPRPPGNNTGPTVDYRDRFTKVIRTDRTREWTIPHSQFFWSNRQGALLSTYKWSTDGRFLYLLWQYYPGPSGGGAPVIFYQTGEDALFRLDLDSGVFETILPYDKNQYAFALSPDDRFLAYRNPGGHAIIHLREMATNEERQTALSGDYDFTGACTWRPDGTSVFFASGIPGWEEGKAGISIFSVAARDMTLRTILTNDKRMWIPYPCWDGSSRYSWGGDNLLCVLSLDENSGDAFHPFLLNVDTGEISPAPSRMPPAGTATGTPSVVSG